MMKTLELTQDACDMICKCIKHRMEYLQTINDVYVDTEEGLWSNEIVKAYNDNCESIAKLQTLMNYIES